MIIKERCSHCGGTQHTDSSGPIVEIVCMMCARRRDYRSPEQIARERELMRQAHRELCDPSMQPRRGRPVGSTKRQKELRELQDKILDEFFGVNPLRAL